MLSVIFHKRRCDILQNNVAIQIQFFPCRQLFIIMGSNIISRLNNHEKKYQMVKTSSYPFKPWGSNKINLTTKELSAAIFWHRPVQILMIHRRNCNEIKGTFLVYYTHSFDPNNPRHLLKQFTHLKQKIIYEIIGSNTFLDWLTKLHDRTGIPHNVLLNHLL